MTTKLIHYMLNEDHSISTTEDAVEWGQWFDNPEKRIVVQEEVGGFWVSTVFLGINHNYTRKGQPILFETMVFSIAPVVNDITVNVGEREGPDGRCERYATWEEAVEGHRRVCDSLTSGLSREELEASRAIIEPLIKD